MSATTAGLTFGTKRLAPGYPQVRRDDAGRWSLEYLYQVHKDTAKDQAPAHNSNPPSPESGDGDLSSLRCSTVEILPHNDPVNRYLRVVYTAPGYGQPQPGETIRSTVSAVQERTVDEILSDSLAAEKKAEGRRTALYFTLSYRRRTVESSFNWTEANVISGLGKRAAPTDLTSPTTNAWLKTERNCTELDEGGDVEVEDVWTYDENLWDTDVYGT